MSEKPALPYAALTYGTLTYIFTPALISGIYQEEVLTAFQTATFMGFTAGISLQAFIFYLTYQLGKQTSEQEVDAS